MKCGAPLANASPYECASLARRVDRCSLVSAFEDGHNKGASSGTSVSHEYPSAREYPSRHKYSLHSTMTRDSLPPLTAQTNDVSEKASKTSAVGKTQHQQRSFGNTDGGRYASQSLDRRKGRISFDNWKRKRKVLARPSPEDTALSTAVTTDCPSSSSKVNTLNRAGRLSVTITDNEPEPEMQRTIDVGRMTVPSLDTERHKNSRSGNGAKTYCGQLYTAPADINNNTRNRKYFQGRETSPSANSDNDINCGKSSSSEATVTGVCEGDRDEEATIRTKERLRHRPKRPSTLSSSDERCVDAAVQVEVEELQLTNGKSASSRPTSRSNRATKVAHAQTSTADLDRTDTGQSPESELLPSMEYFRRSGKDVWRASMALHGSRRKDSAEIQNENNRTTSERSMAKKPSRRRHRHSVASLDFQHQNHLSNASLHNNHREKTVDVVPAETYRASDMEWQNEMEKILVEERCAKRTANSERKSAELRDLLQNGDPAADQGYRKNVEVQPPSVQIQSPPAASLDSSLVEIVVREWCQSEKLGNITNRIPSNRVDETSEKQAEYETTVL